jgi:hypothetical protein
MPLQPDTAVTFSQILQKIDSENTQNQLNSKKIIQANIFILLSELERLVNNDSVKRNKTEKTLSGIQQIGKELSEIILIYRR